MHPIELDELKSIELDILLAFHDYCEQKGLSYMLYYGTLLGAVRHQGFIPWDDDIDVVMPRDDYEAFFRSFPCDSSFETIKLISYRDRSSIYPFIKLVDTRTEVVEDFVDPRYKTGVWIDIFPMDGLPEDDRPFKENRKAMRKYDFTVGDTTTGTTPFRCMAKRLLTPILASSDIYRVAARLDAIASETSIDPRHDVGAVVWGYGKRERMPYPILERTLLDFEGHRLYAPTLYEECLTRIFGDFRTPPPENERKPHAIHATWIAD